MATFRGGLVSAQSTPSPYTQANQLINYLFIIFGPAWGLSFLSFPSACTQKSQFKSFCSLWGGCSQSPFCVGYRPRFEGCPRIWYFAGLQIVGLGGARAHNLWGSEVLANRVRAGSEGNRTACERLGGAASH